VTTLSFLTAPLPRLLFFGGKGGVGKTSLAAATSLSLAQLHPQQRIMVASTDPAHSLADGFGCALGPVPSVVYDQPNLFGLEIDARAALRAFLVSPARSSGTSSAAARIWLTKTFHDCSICSSRGSTK
jgi:arsenite-transporting ATPase